MPANLSLDPGLPYSGAREHLDEHLGRVQRWLERHRLLFPDRHGDAPKEADAEARGEKLAHIASDLEVVERHIADRERATDHEGGVLPLLRLRRFLQLSSHEVDLLVALLAMEAEPEFYRAYSRAWGDGKQGDVAFFAELVGGRGPERYAIEGAMQPGGVLARHGLIALAADRSWLPGTPLLYLKVKLGSRVASFLQGELLPQPHTLPHSVSIYHAQKGLDELVLPDGAAEPVATSLLAAVRDRRAMTSGRRAAESDRRAMTSGRTPAPDATPEAPLIDPICLVGPRHSGRKALCAALLPDAPLVVIAAGGLPKEREAFDQVVREALCEAVLQGGALYVDGAESLDEESLRFRLAELLDGIRTRLILASDGSVEPLTEAFPRVLRVDLQMSDALTQTALWSRLLPADVQLDASCDLGVLTTQYSLPAGSIHRCVEELVRRARVRGPRGPQNGGPGAFAPTIQLADALEVVRRQLGNRFGDLAQLVSNSFTWDDLILPDDVLQRVLEVVAYAKHRDRILKEWGFERKLPYGRSISVLLAGAPGTGKTMVASLLAREMGLELFRVNVSKVVDKYIGETEKNLARIFDEARRGQVALLFDEADSLFSKRTEIKSSTDRYSNLAVNYLLQAVESHDGVIILTTNHEKAMDEAFRRRIRFRVSFPVPNDKERARLWQSMLPGDAPVEPGVDWLMLGQMFNLTGGAIKNAVVRAALHAAAMGDLITADILRLGARLEAEELGCLVMSHTAPPQLEPGEHGEGEEPRG